MTKPSRNVAERRGAGRLWSFGDVVFDEAKWSLQVSGKRVQLEQKPMELLHELLLNAGQTVSKDDLLERVWADVTVVEASLPTAMLKLRRAIGDTDRAHPMIETVAKVGYCLAAPVAVREHTPSAQGLPTGPGVIFGRRAGDRAGPGSRWTWPLVAGVAVALAGGGLALAQFGKSDATAAVKPGPPIFTNQEVHNALKRLDVAKVDAMLAAGWNPDVELDVEGDTPLTLVLEVCEWNPDHDPQKLVQIERSLIDGGAKLHHRNVFGDTAYSVARSKRFCGPDHPATVLITSLCTNQRHQIEDGCLPMRKGKLVR